MIIVNREAKETIKVYHNSVEEMLENIKKLKEDGWSDNIRLSIARFPLVKLKLYSFELDEFKTKYPKVKIHEEDDSDWPYSKDFYIYCTIHERTIK